MKKINYEKIAKLIDEKLEVYRDGDFVYLLYPNPPENGNIQFQEISDALIVWSNDYKDKTIYEVYKIIVANTNTNIIFPFVETREEFEAVLKLNTVKFDFQADGCEDYSKEYGSFILRR